MIIDTHVHLGKIARYEYTNYTIEHLVRVWDKVGVSMACLSSSRALFATPSEGNDEILDAFRRFPERIIPLVSLNPLFGIKETISEMERCHQQGFKGVKLLPGENRYPLEFAKPIIQKAAQWDWPVLIHSPDPVALEKILEECPEAKILMAHCRGEEMEWTEEKKREQLAKRFPNVVVEISGMGGAGPGRFKRFVDSCGAENIVFGSDLPCVYVRATLKVIECSTVSAHEKEMILWRNAAQLFNIPANKVTKINSQHIGWKGEIIDVCCRYGFDARTGTKGMERLYEETMRRYGITNSFVYSIEALTYDFKSGNEKTVEFCKEHGANPLCFVNPGFLASALEEVKRTKKKGFQGIIIGPAYNAWFDEFALRTVVAEAVHTGLPILIEMTEPGGGSLTVNVGALLLIAKKYPKSSFIFVGLSAKQWPLLHTARDIDNIYFGSALQFSDALKKAVEIVGAGRMVFESFLPYHDPGKAIGYIEESDLSFQEKKAIFSENVRRIFAPNTVFWNHTYVR